MTETGHVCRQCGMVVEYIEAMPDFGIGAEWVHRRGRWRVPADHEAQPIEVWSCPDCPWEHRAHPFYGWSRDHDRAVEVHRTMLCPVVSPPASEGGPSDA